MLAWHGPGRPSTPAAPGELLEVMERLNSARPTLSAFAAGYVAGHYLFRWFVHLTKAW
jgi:hypothetical protein